MNKVVLVCTGVPQHAGPDAARDIQEEFTHRTWHKDVRCEWDGTNLILTAHNDYDPKGLALMDEFSDAISAYIAEPFDGDIELLSSTPQ